MLLPAANESARQVGTRRVNRSRKTPLRRNPHWNQKCSPPFHQRRTEHPRIPPGAGGPPPQAVLNGPRRVQSPLCAAGGRSVGKPVRNQAIVAKAEPQQILFRLPLI